MGDMEERHEGQQGYTSVSERAAGEKVKPKGAEVGEVKNLWVIRPIGTDKCRKEVRLSGRDGESCQNDDE